jgi:hypothetical protein
LLIGVEQLSPGDSGLLCPATPSYGRAKRELIALADGQNASPTLQPSVSVNNNGLGNKAKNEYWRIQISK